MVKIMSTLELLEQVVPIEYDQAMLMYNLGFKIEVEILEHGAKKTVVLDENSIERGSFDAQLIKLQVVDEELKPLKKARFFADDSLLKHCGLHIMYSDGRSSQIEYGKYDERIR